MKKLNKDFFSKDHCILISDLSTEEKDEAIQAARELLEVVSVETIAEKAGLSNEEALKALRKLFL